MIDASGLTIKRLSQIKAEIESSLRAAFGNQINTLPQSVIGQFVGISAEREAAIYELIEDVYHSQYPDSAEGVNFDRAASIVSFTRLPALYSSIVGEVLIGTAGTIIPIGTVFSVAGSPTSTFETITEVTLTAGVDEVQNVAFSATPTSGSFKLVFSGQTTALINWNDDAAAVQTALNNLSNLSGVTVSGSFAAGFAVTFAGADGKKPQPAMTYSDNTLDFGGAVTITITETTPGEYQGTVDMIATQTGPIIANAGTLTVIDNPIAGLTSVYNPEDAAIGRAVETDAEARIRRRNRLQISVAGPLDAIRNAVLRLNDVEDSILIEDVRAFENVTLLTDARGIPGKAFEVYAYQAAGATSRDQEIIDAIGGAKPAGIEAHGDVSGVYIDNQGQSHTVKFSRPIEIDIYLELDLTVTGDYPADGDNQVKAAIVEWGDDIGTGNDVIVYGTNSLLAQLNSIEGITDVVVRIGTAASPTLDDNIIIDDGLTPGVQVEKSSWDTGRIIIAHV